MSKTPDETGNRSEARIVVLTRDAKPVERVIELLGDRARRALWVDAGLRRSSEREVDPLAGVAIRRIIVEHAPEPWADLAPLRSSGLLPERVELSAAGHAYTRAATWDTLLER